MDKILENARIAQLYNSKADWIAMNPVLEAGEIGIESDTSLFKVGDGTTPWNELDYSTTKVIDSLDSSDTKTALSANQGRILNEKIQTLGEDYLPLDGGTMRGPITSQDIVPQSDDASHLGADTVRYKSSYLTTGVYLGNAGDGKGIFFNEETGGFDFIC